MTLSVRHKRKRLPPMVRVHPFGDEESVQLEGRKEMFYITTHSNTFYLRLYCVGHMVKNHSDSENVLNNDSLNTIYLRLDAPTDRLSHSCTSQCSTTGVTKKEGIVLFNDALNTFNLRLYGVGHMVKDHSDSEGGNPLPPHRLRFPISSKGSFICTIPQTGYHIPRPMLHQS